MADDVLGFTDSIFNLFIVFIGIILVILFLTKFAASISTMDVVPDVAKTAASDGLDSMKVAYNWFPFVLYIGLTLISIVAIRKSNMTWLPIIWGFLFIGYIGLVLMIPSNVYEDLKLKQVDISSMGDDMPIFDYFLLNVPMFGALYLVITGIALITKPDTPRVMS